MSYVDKMGFVRWVEQDHVNRVEAFVTSRVPHLREHVLIRRMLGFLMFVNAQMLPAGPLKTMLGGMGKPLPEKALAELTTAAQVYLEADALAEEARADAALLHGALDHEEAVAALAALQPAPATTSPSVPEAEGEEEGEDLFADQRAALAAKIAAVTPEVLALVEERYAFHNLAPAAVEETPVEEPEPTPEAVP